MRLAVRLTALLLLATPSVAAFGATASSPSVSSSFSSPDPRLGDSYKFHEGGWTYVHLSGTPEEIGFQHGYLLAREIEDNVQVYSVEGVNVYKRPWEFFRQAGKNVLWPKLDPEYQAELKGIAEGLKAQGSKVDLWDMVAINGNEELTGYYLPMVGREGRQAGSGGGQGSGEV